MTSTTANAVHSASLTEKLASGFRFAFDVMANASVGMACSREAERLQRLSDADLAKLGLTRDGIIQRAFARYLV